MSYQVTKWEGTVMHIVKLKENPMCKAFLLI